MSGAVGKRHRRRRSNRDLGVRGQNESMERRKIIDRVDLFMKYSYRYGYRYQYMRESGIDWESSIREERMNKVRAARQGVSDNTCQTASRCLARSLKPVFTRGEVLATVDSLMGLAVGLRCGGNV